MNSSSNKIALLALLVALVALTCVFTRSPASTTAAPKKETAFERVMRTRTIRCAYTTSPPNFMVDPNTKQKSGVFYDTMEAVGKTIGLKIEWAEETSITLLDQNLNSGKQDVFCGAIYASASKGQKVEFVAPLAYAPLHLYARGDDFRFDNDLKTVNSETATIAVMDGSTMKGVADATFPKAKQFSIQEAEPPANTLIAVSSRKADVALFTPTNAYDYNLRNPDNRLRQVAGPPIRLIGLSFGVAKGEWELRDLLSEAVSELQGDGTIDRIIGTYEPAPGMLLRVAKPYVETEK